MVSYFSIKVNQLKMYSIMKHLVVKFFLEVRGNLLTILTNMQYGIVSTALNLFL